MDGALAFVSTHCWVPRPLAVALLGTVESNADASAEPDRVREMVERALNELHGPRLAVAQFTDRLLDLRNAAQPARIQLASSANR